VVLKALRWGHVGRHRSDSHDLGMDDHHISQKNCDEVETSRATGRAGRLQQT
jgi:hypothetical protein